MGTIAAAIATETWVPILSICWCCCWCGHLSKRNIDDSATLLNTGTSLFNSLDVGVWEDFIISPIHDSMNMLWSHFCSPAAFHTNHTPTQVFYAPCTCMHTATKRPICTLYSGTSLKGLSESRTQCKKTSLLRTSFAVPMVPC